MALNFLQRLSGVATLARRYAEPSPARLPRARYPQDHAGTARTGKAAAAAGGVTNHRMGLYDAILIKNNHIAAAGGVRKAIEARARHRLPIEIEVRTRAELREALEAARRICCSTTSRRPRPQQWIRWIAGRAKVELSGGITLENVRAYAETGADFVSSGAITHSARAMDISFRLELE